MLNKTIPHRRSLDAEKLKQIYSRRFERIMKFQRLINLSNITPEKIRNEFIRLSRLVSGAAFNNNFHHPYDYIGMSVISNMNGLPDNNDDFYSGMDLKNTIIKIKCNRCDNNHEVNCKLIDFLLGAGCTNCLKENSTKYNGRYTTERYILLAEITHFPNDKYDYSEVEYIGAREKIKIYCYDCKEFSYKTASDHIHNNKNNKTNGCIKCRNRDLVKTTDEFIIQSKLVHGNKYDYSSSNYISCNTSIKIFCYKCKVFFSQTPTTHLQGRGCRRCSYQFKSEKLTKPFNTFVIEANIIHKNRYIYIDSHYQTANHKINIQCRLCGMIFSQTPTNHLQGHGCPCNRRKSYNNLIVPIHLYLLKISFNENNNHLYKLGITLMSIDKRYRSELLPGVSYEIIYDHIFEPGHLAAKIEHKITRECFKYRYFGKRLFKNTGNSEVFVEDILPILLKHINEELNESS